MNFILLLGILSCTSNASVVFPKTSLSKSEMAEHLLNRAAFGPRPGDVITLSHPGALEKWFEQQLDPSNISELALENKLKKLKSLSMDTAALLSEYKTMKGFRKEFEKKSEDPSSTQNQDFDKVDFNKKKFNKEHKDMLPNNIVNELTMQKITRAVESKKQLQEVLVDFWFNHFNVDVRKGKVRWYVSNYEREAIRKNIFGTFEGLLQATAKDPAMLFYLDNWQSVKEGFVPKKKKNNEAEPLPKGLNENYARELMELHTLGVDGGYTQADIIQVARAFTGWTIKEPAVEGAFLFRPLPHDTSDVKILGNVFHGSDGVKQGEKILSYLAHHPSTAKFIAKKLCQRFVSDEPPASCIVKVAQRFMESKGDLKQVYLALFTSNEFWASANKKIKKPFDFLVSSVRALGGEVDPVIPRKGKNLVTVLGYLGEPAYSCSPPTGYKDLANTWVNTGSLVARLNASMSLASGRWEQVHWDPSPFFLDNKKHNEISNAAMVLTNRKISEETKTVMEKILTGTEDGADDRDLKKGERIRLIALLLGSPEFQKR